MSATTCPRGEWYDATRGLCVPGSRQTNQPVGTASADTSAGTHTVKTDSHQSGGQHSDSFPPVPPAGVAGQSWLSSTVEPTAPKTDGKLDPMILLAVGVAVYFLMER